MALAIVWTKRAIDGYDKIVQYLVENWTDREIRNFIQESEEFFNLLSHYPELLPKTNMLKNVYRGPMNKFTMITYRLKPRKQQIELINIRSSRQKPLLK